MITPSLISSKKRLLKRLLMVFFLLMVFLGIANGKAFADTESETIPLLTNGELQLNTVKQDDLTNLNPIDWWTVTTQQNGQLSFTLKGPVRTNGNLILYDVDAKTEITRVHVEGINPGNINASLFSGTYYVKIERSSGDEWAYQLTNSFTVPTFSPDNEPNENFYNAGLFKLDAPVTGQVGYYGNGFWDIDDQWEINTTQDGNLSINIEASASAKGVVRLYAVSGWKELTNFTIGTENVLSGKIQFNIMPGKYCVVVHRDANSWEYKLTPTFTTASLATDEEPNNMGRYNAEVLNANATATGHIGYFNSDTQDSEDWWQVTIPQDGTLKVNLTANTIPKGSIRLYSAFAELKSAEVNSDITSANLELSKLKAGTYYLKITNDKRELAWSYTIANTLTPMAADPNRFDGSGTLPMGGSVNGGIDANNPNGYWQVTTTEDGLLTVNLTAGANPGCYFHIYDTNGEKELRNEWVDDPKTKDISINLKPGTYYVWVQRWYDRSYAYTLSASLTAAAYTNDQEANEHWQIAAPLALNSSATGHLGYYSSNDTDANDWWKVTTTEDGLLSVTLTATANPGCYFHLYDVDGYREIQNIWIDDPKTGTVSCTVRPGTYYLWIQRWYDRVYSYKLESKFAAAAYANDSEQNDGFKLAQSMGLNSTGSGHLGYYSNSYRDSNDWWKVTTTKDGRLTVSIEADANPGCYFRLYDVNGSRELANIWVDSPTGRITKYLKPGTYYVWVQRWYDRVYSYKVSSEFTAAAFAKDTDIYESFEAPVALAVNSMTTGHIGYYANNYTDTGDAWKVDLPADGMLTVNFVATNFDGTGTAKAGAYLHLYAPDKTTELANIWMDSLESSSIQKAALKAGSYYIWLQRWYDRVYSYTLTNTFSTTDAGQLAPVVIGNYPLDKAKAYKETYVAATFSKNMDAKTINKETFILKDSGGNVVTGTVGYSGTIATMVPDFPLNDNESYTVMISNGVTDTFGKPLAINHQWNFTTGVPDEDGTTIPPSVPVTGISLDKTDITLETGGASITLQATVKPDNASNTKVNWESSDETVVTVANGIVTPVNTDRGEKALAIIIASTEDGNKKAVCNVTVNPESVEEKPTPSPCEFKKMWTIKFNKAVDTDSVNEQNITVTDTGDNSSVLVTVAPGSDGKSVLVFAPKAGYKSGHSYILKVSTQVKSADSSAKALKKVVIMKFTVQ